MSDIPIQVSAITVEKSDDKFIVTFGAAKKTNILVLTTSMALLLVDKIGMTIATEETPLE